MADQMSDAGFDAFAARLADPATPAPGVSDVAIGDAAAARGRALTLREHGSEQSVDTVLRQAGRTGLGYPSKNAQRAVRGLLPEHS